MIVIRNIKQMSRASGRLKGKNKSIGFVATMGALHEGHLSLIRQARKDNDIVVVSIFVNPIQFGPTEDFKRYPRPINKDFTLCRKAGVDFVFYPKASAMYPQGVKTYVEVKDLSKMLCGKHRPGHFTGVTTVVAKLFNIIRPDIAYFGQKDAQQAVIIKRMSEDLNFPLQIKIMPTLREKNGLAISSRDIYLNQAERMDALSLSQGLNLAGDLLKCGMQEAAKIILEVKRLIRKRKSAKIDYVAIVDLNNLNPVKRISGKCLLALAVRIGKTRLIDNTIIRDGSRSLRKLSRRGTLFG